MSDVRDYPSRMGDAASGRTGTFSYLPEMDEEELREQIEFLTRQGLVPAIEHVEPERSTATYWYLWKLPLFGTTASADVLDQLKACREANPRHHVRLIGYDNRRQTQGVSLIAYRGGQTAATDPQPSPSMKSGK